jgi:HAD superfamily phosphatase (TIGR01668 family)
MRLTPTYIAERVTDINLDDLRKEGIKGLIFDLDNTIMPPGTGIYPPDIAEWLEEVKKEFKIAILSNNPYTNYVRKAGEDAGCPAYNKAGKPRRGMVRQALKDLELLPEQTVIIGDRPLTDIWVGQRLGMVTILVDPLRKHQEMAVVKLLRRLERLFISPALKKFSGK